MSIYVRINESETIDIDLMDISKVQDIIDYIKEIYGYHTDVMYSGELLDPDAVIADTDICSESMLDVSRKVNKHIACGDYHTVALKEDGSVVAWGNNEYGQCNVPEGLKAIKIASGYRQSMAIKEDGSVVAWGDNEYGQRNIPEGLKAIKIASGDRHSMVIKEDGSVVAWGDNEYGQRNIPEGLKAIKIACGWYHTVALKEDGSVIAWGDNRYGQCNVPDELL